MMERERFFERSSVFAPFSAQRIRVARKEGVCRRASFHVKLRVIEMVMKRSISVNPSGRC